MVSTTAYKLFTPLKLGENLELKNPIVFGPLTRGRAGMIISEGTGVSEQEYGWHHAAACYTDVHMRAGSV
ncbi:12-oxophytodienoate reductase [Phytophthora palmivora]|uniref:12-oxophytodienoate reductase n=1 Tax=Phytophthora palmivora TaxID=4796 RepID=A0A2P4XGG7_9STRA|nr:12-oxophytodienoate reductase [Phytophthora palmivora]